MNPPEELFAFPIPARDDRIFDFDRTGAIHERGLLAVPLQDAGGFHIQIHHAIRLRRDRGGWPDQFSERLKIGAARPVRDDQVEQFFDGGLLCRGTREESAE